MQMKPFLKKLIGFVSSLKITTTTLALFAATFIINAHFGSTSLSSGGGVFHHILNFFGLTDMFHSWWLIALLSLFSLNLLTCSLKRLPRTLKILKPKKEICNEDFIDCLPLRKEWSWENFKPQSSEGLVKIIDRYCKTPLIENGTNGLTLFAEKGKYSLLGFYLGHLGILVMLVGGIFNSFGYQGYLKINKGEVVDTCTLRKRSENLQHKIGFSIRCDDYKEIYYEGSDKVKDHQSTLTLLKEEKEVKTATIDFSHPLEYQGVYVYQTLDGHVFDESSGKGLSLLVVSRRDQYKSKIYEGNVGDQFKMEETGHTIKFNTFASQYVVEDRDETGSIVPAVELMILDGEKILYQGWVSSKASASNDYYFSLLPGTYYTYTRLKISRIPGEHLVGYGFIAMIIGFGISFFISHRRIWLRIEESEGMHHVSLAGATNKNLTSFERDFINLYQDLKKQHSLCEVENFARHTTTFTRGVYGHDQYSAL